MKLMTLLLSACFGGVLALTFLAGCASGSGEMNGFVGQPSSELLARLGPPKLRVPEGQGGQIWTYVEDGPTPVSAPATFPGAMNGAGAGAASQASPMISPAFAAKREFFIDANGTIYKYRSNAH